VETTHSAAYRGCLKYQEVAATLVHSARNRVTYQVAAMSLAIEKRTTQRLEKVERLHAATTRLDVDTTTTVSRQKADGVLPKAKATAGALSREPVVPTGTKHADPKPANGPQVPKQEASEPSEDSPSIFEEWSSWITSSRR